MSQFITIDGVIVEVESVGGIQMASADESRVSKKSLAQMESIFSSLGEHLKNSWAQLNTKVKVKEAQVELGLGFEAKGNLFIAQGKSSAQLKVTFKFEPDQK